MSAIQIEEAAPSSLRLGILQMVDTVRRISLGHKDSNPLWDEEWDVIFDVDISTWFTTTLVSLSLIVQKLEDTAEFDSASVIGVVDEDDASGFWC